MATTLQAVRGMHDILPPQSRYFAHLEQTAREVLGAYGYDEIRLPLVERTELFKRTIGDETFGMAGPDIDAELLLLTQRLWRRRGVEGLVLQLNSLGTPAVRAAYREQLVTYFS